MLQHCICVYGFQFGMFRAVSEFELQRLELEVLVGANGVPQCLLGLLELVLGLDQLHLAGGHLGL
jgi:hypothetical protein